MQGTFRFQHFKLSPWISRWTKCLWLLSVLNLTYFIPHVNLLCLHEHLPWQPSASLLSVEMPPRTLKQGVWSQERESYFSWLYTHISNQGLWGQEKKQEPLLTHSELVVTSSVVWSHVTLFLWKYFEKNTEAVFTKCVSLSSVNPFGSCHSLWSLSSILSTGRTFS